MVVPVVVASKTEVCDGREEGWKSSGLWLPFTPATAVAVSSELEKKAGMELLAMELRRESSRW